MKTFPQVRVTEKGCWEWIGPKDEKRGYGRVNLSGMSFGAHRLFYFLFNGHFDTSLLICHTCDNPPCVNPEHLFCGTQKDNQEDCKKKGRLGRRGSKPIWWEDRKEVLRKVLSKLKTESEVARYVGVSRQAVNLWYRGLSNPNKTSRQKLIFLVTGGAVPGSTESP